MEGTRDARRAMLSRTKAPTERPEWNCRGEVSHISLSNGHSRAGVLGPQQRVASCRVKPLDITENSTGGEQKAIQGTISHSAMEDRK